MVETRGNKPTSRADRKHRGDVINISLTALAREQLKLATSASSGRSSHTVHGGHERTLHQTLIALAAGRSLGEHANPGEATVHVLHGRVRLVAGTDSWDGAQGHLMVVPDRRHSLEALEDAVVLLTVVNVSRPEVRANQ